MKETFHDSDQAHVHAVPSRRDALIAGAALVAAPFLGRVTSIVQETQGANTVLRAGSPAHAQAGKVQGTATEWLSYGGDKASSKYSPLTQINGDNFPRLRFAWTWCSAEEEVAKANHLKTWAWEATPLMVGGVLYVSTSLSQVAAIDAVTGKTQWVYFPFPAPKESYD
jgi:glucose dehydrogenase